MVIDAGSSSSKLFVYSWPDHTGESDKLLHIRPVRDPEGKPVYAKVKQGLCR